MFKLDFSQFKKVSSDKHSTTLQHPAGHTIRIAHQSVHPKIREQLAALPMLAQGGQVEAAKKSVAKEVPYAEGTPDAPIQASQEPQQQALEQDTPDKIAADAAATPKEAKPSPVVVNVNNPASAPAQSEQQPQQPPMATQVGHAIGSMLRGNPAILSAKMGAEAVGKAADVGNQVMQGVSSGLSNEPIQAPNQPAQQQPQGASRPVAKAPAQPPQGPQVDPFLQSINSEEANTMKAFEQKAQGIKDEAAATGAMGTEQAKMFQDGADTQAGILKDAKHKFEGINNEMAANIQDLKDSHHVDPSHYWSNKDTGSKILTGIGLLLSGWGSGISGQPNAALDMLNKQIDRDIDSQKANIGKKENLVTAYYRQFQNVKDATEMARLTQMTIVDDQLKKAAAEASDPVAKARALQASADLDVQKTQAMQQFALRKALIGAEQNNPDKFMPYLRLMNPAMAKERESRSVPGMGMASIPVDAKGREELIARESLQQQVSNLRKWAQSHSGDLNPEDIAYGRALAASVQDAYRRANGQGVFREAESNFVKGIVEDDPTKFLNKYRVDPKYKALEDSNLLALNGLKQGYGIPIQNAVDRLSPQQQSFVQWAKQNPTNPKAMLIFKRFGLQ